MKSKITYLVAVITMLQVATTFAQVTDLKGGPLGIERVAGRTHNPAYKSVVSDSPQATGWIQVDLGKSYPIDLVKLYPYVHDHWDVFTRPGFPLRFKIEVAGNEAFTNPRLVFDHTKADYAETVTEKIDSYKPLRPVSGRYVRLTVTKMQNNKDKYYFDLWRFEVISAGKDVAEGRTLFDSASGYLGKHVLLRPQRPLGEGVVFDHPEQVTPPNTWKPVEAALRTPQGGVTVDGLFGQVIDRNTNYLLKSFTVNDMIRDFRKRVGKPVPEKKDRDYEQAWVTILGGSLAGRYMMGAGNQLRWKEDAELRKGMNQIVDAIDDCAEPNGYIMGFPERNILFCETGGYSRSWLTQGLIEAGIAGNDKAFPLLRRFYDWFNTNPYLPELLQRGGFGIQGTIGSTRTYVNTPIGVPADIQTIQRYYQLNFWLDQLADRDPDAIWQYPYDRSHCYLIVALNAYMDMYMATGDKKYLDAVSGGWDIYHDYFEHVGGSIAISEMYPYPPKSYLLHAGTGELCGSSFWTFLNQQFRVIYPDEEKYVNEIEKSIYNVGIANQKDDGKIRYHARLINKKDAAGDGNTCCEGQGTRLLGALPEFIYKIAADGLYVDLYNESSIIWEQDGQSLSLHMHSNFPDKPEVKLHIALKKNMQSKIRIRVPSWASSAMDIWVNGKKAASGTPGSYVMLNRVWKNNDEIRFTLPIDFRLTKYTGIADNFQGKEAYALEYGPLLMAVTGNSIENGCVNLSLTTTELTSQLKPIAGKPLHFAISDENNALEYMPYYKVNEEKFTCYPFFK
ncbi:Non-reducing end beta-L-arabinofuranosidase [termite gut metagenome]|uniref:Non-reducing end beta-L-arabinofuranosidase n=1 Tax=termite gut metagenome TaxID=433724 RepID=A0A5J4RIC0_9ZZZZ